MLCTSKLTHIVRQLECPVCLLTMRPPIFLCSTGHSICEGCYKTVDKCPQCNMVYGIISDRFEGMKVMPFKCSCYSDGLLASHFGVMGNGNSYKIGCLSCETSFKVVPFNGELIPEKTFRDMKDAYQPQRNYALEALTVCILYPCEDELCDTKFLLSEQIHHQSVCKYRSVHCPCYACHWQGPVNGIIAHFVNSIHDDCHYVVLKNVMLKIQIPMWKSCMKVVILNDVDDFPDSVFACKLISSPSGLLLSFTHYGTVPSSGNFVGMVTLYCQKDPTFYRSITLPLRRDVEVGVDLTPLCSFKWLINHGYFDANSNLHVKIQCVQRDMFKISNTGNAAVSVADTSDEGATG